MNKKENSCCDPAVSAGCCSGSPGCCEAARDIPKSIVIDFLYIDLSVCDRCQGTGETLTEAVEDVRKILKAAGYAIQVNYIHVQTEKQAEEIGFIISPTIRINGQDIQMDTRETLCESCGDLCGKDIDCRVWVYNGVEYTVPPKPMIVNAILGHIYGGETKVNDADVRKGGVPHNLKKFFASRK